MSYSRVSCYGLVMVFGVLSSVSIHAEGLLWKTTSRYQPRVVPPYVGQESPFPPVVLSQQVDAQEGPTLEDLEVERQQQEAIDKATQLIASPEALVPYMEGAVIGGMVQGVNGRKILVGNEWIGPGMSMNVRLMASEAVRDAIRRVSDFNPDMAKSLTEQVSLRLRQTPLTRMKLKDIQKDTLVLVGEYGVKTMKFSMQ